MTVSVWSQKTQTFPFRFFFFRWNIQGKWMNLLKSEQREGVRLIWQVEFIRGEYEYFSTCAYLQYSLSFNAQFSLFILFFFRCSECEETRNGICASKFSVLTQWRLLGLTTTKWRRLYNISEVLESTLHYFDRIVTNETPKYAWNSAKYTTGLSSTSEML